MLQKYDIMDSEDIGCNNGLKDRTHIVLLNKNDILEIIKCVLYTHITF